jgi:molybdopterin-guanine dinucleotide biosynthesis protein
MATAVPVIVITGTMGSGKTTILSEASDILTARGVLHAAIDMDALGVGNVPDAAGEDLAYRNLEAVWRNFARAGATRLLIAEAVESAAGLDRIRLAVAGAQIVTCRLTAPLATMKARVSRREPGMLHDSLVARVETLAAILDAAGVEDFSLANADASPATEVASQLLGRAGWIE